MLQRSCLALAVVSIALAGCGPESSSAPTGPATAAAQFTPAARTQSAAPLPPPTATGASYDYYLLNLSWSPEFCATDPASAECPQHLGFVVHGLWPENDDGTYPKNCVSRPGPTNPSVWAGLMPTAALAQHEWQTHGICTPYDADTYFGLVRRAFNAVQIPPAFTPAGATAAGQTMEPPAQVIAAFAKVNTGFPAGSIALSCGNNQLTAMEFCFSKELQPIACSGVKSCRANVVKITPP